MRKSLLFCPLAIFLLVIACRPNKETAFDDPVESISFTIGRFIDHADDTPFSTKTSMNENGEFLWSGCDTVGIYPNTGAQVYFAMTEGEGASSASFDGGGWDFKASATYYSYYPFIGNIYLDRNHIPVSYLGQKQTGITDTSHIGPFDFMYTPGTSSSSGNLHFEYIHLNCILRFRLTLPAGEYTRLTISAQEPLFVQEGYYDLMATTPAIVPTKYTDHLSMDLNNISSDGTEFKVFMLIAPINLVGKEWTVSVLNGNKTELQCVKTTSKVFAPEGIYGFTCTSWTEVPQTMGFSMRNWDIGTTITGIPE